MCISYEHRIGKWEFSDYTIAGDLRMPAFHYQNGSDGRSYFILDSYSYFAGALYGAAALPGALMRAAFACLKKDFTKARKNLICFKFVLLGTLKGIVSLICSIADPIIFFKLQIDKQMKPQGRGALLIVGMQNDFTGMKSFEVLPEKLAAKKKTDEIAEWDAVKNPVPPATGKIVLELPSTANGLKYTVYGEEKGAAKIIPVINKVMEEFPDLVFASQEWHPENHGSFAENLDVDPYAHHEKLMGVPQTPWPKHCVQGTAGAQLSVGLDLKKINRVFRNGMDWLKESRHAFDNPLTQEIFRSKNIKRLYIVGTGPAVKATALEAKKRGFSVILFSDAITGGAAAKEFDGMLISDTTTFFRL